MSVEDAVEGVIVKADRTTAQTIQLHNVRLMPGIVQSNLGCGLWRLGTLCQDRTT